MLGSQLHSDFDLFSFRDCQEKDNRIKISHAFTCNIFTGIVFENLFGLNHGLCPFHISHL